MLDPACCNAGWTTVNDTVLSLSMTALRRLLHCLLYIHSFTRTANRAFISVLTLLGGVSSHLESLQHLVGVSRSDLSGVRLDRDRLDDTVLNDDGTALQAGSAKDGLGVEDETGGVGKGAAVVGGYLSAFASRPMAQCEVGCFPVASHVRQGRMARGSL